MGLAGRVRRRRGAAVVASVLIAAAAVGVSERPAAGGATDRAVYDQGAWYIQGQPTVFWGLAGDIPLPLPHAIRSRFFA